MGMKGKYNFKGTWSNTMDIIQDKKGTKLSKTIQTC